MGDKGREKHTGSKGFLLVVVFCEVFVRVSKGLE